MSKPSRIISLFLLVCCLFMIFAACIEDPYKDYVASGLEPKTMRIDYSEKIYTKWNSNTKLNYLTSYTDYENFDIDLGYTKAYFELNSLLIILQTTCSSENHQFIEIVEKDGKLYPVVEHNYIGPDDPITEDIIFYVFYAEIPNSGYTIGELILRTRSQNVMQ